MARQIELKCRVCKEVVVKGEVDDDGKAYNIWHHSSVFRGKFKNGTPEGRFKGERVAHTEEEGKVKHRVIPT